MTHETMSKLMQLLIDAKADYNFIQLVMDGGCREIYYDKVKPYYAEYKIPLPKICKTFNIMIEGENLYIGVYDL
jgi:hypothetical protein